jgi:ATP-dependent helicase HrpB
MKPALPALPIQAVLPELTTKLCRHSTVILAAEPGSGKTTIVPLALLDEPWLKGQKIIVLEPRRLAVRMAAKRMSQLCKQEVGKLVGYRIRFDHRTSAATRIEVITEGVLIRMIQKDPALTGVGMVIFDEFHERTLTADLGLALSCEVQEMREDLKIMIMSATMDNQRTSKVLGSIPIITGKGRCFPVEVEYLPRPSTEYLIPRTVKAIYRALSEQEGDILVFLPGAGDIRRVQAQIKGDCLCLPLYGNLSQQEQDRIFCPTEKRRIILATPIAETSITIEGVRVVIDCGLMKTPQFSSSTGLTTLTTVGISKASARQRTGRAGRLCPGVCYRLWTKGEHHSKPEFSLPEILSADLAPLLLETVQWGVSDPNELLWIDPPRASQSKQARELLQQLTILDESGKLTTSGKTIAKLPLHPRLALMIHKGNEQGLGGLACDLAALLQNRDVFRGNSRDRSVDIEDRLEILHLFSQRQNTLIKKRGADPDLCRKIMQESMQYRRILGIKDPGADFSEAGNLLALAYPDRIAMRKKDTGSHLLSSGRGMQLAKGDHLHHAEFLVAASLDGGKKQGRIYLGAAVSKETLLNHHAHLLETTEQVVWHKNRVESVAITTLGRLDLERTPCTAIDPDAVLHCLLAGIKQTGIHCLNWQNKSRELQSRMQTAHLYSPDTWPDVADATLEENMEWLKPYLDRVTSLKQLRRLDMYQILHARLTWQEQQELERIAPTHIQVPSGSNVKLTYQPGQPPVLAVRLQEMFGAEQTPAIFRGQIPVLIHLLSPASRPIQVTTDLAGFWKSTYYEVKKELQGRYPKHYWPDNPLEAKATARVKPRKR